RRVLLCDGGPRRNAAATHIQNFVTRDGTPPDAFRRMGRAELATYPSVEIRDERVTAVEGDRDGFRVTLDRGAIAARRILLATGMVDEMLPIEDRGRTHGGGPTPLAAFRRDGRRDRRARRLRGRDPFHSDVSARPRADPGRVAREPGRPSGEVGRPRRLRGTGETFGYGPASRWGSPVASPRP